MGAKFQNFNSNDCKGPPSSDSKNRYVLGIIVTVEVTSTKFRILMYTDPAKPILPGNSRGNIHVSK